MSRRTKKTREIKSFRQLLDDLIFLVREYRENHCTCIYDEKGECELCEEAGRILAAANKKRTTT